MKRHFSVTVIGSLFRLRRDLVPHIQKRVLADVKLTMDEADLLLDLYQAWKLKCEEPNADAEGFVSFRALRKSLLNPTLFSRRISKLNRASLLELREDKENVKNLPKEEKVDKRSKSARITQEGIRQIAPLYERYGKLCDELLQDIPGKDQKTVYQVNLSVIKKLRFM